MTELRRSRVFGAPKKVWRAKNSSLASGTDLLRNVKVCSSPSGAYSRRRRRNRLRIRVRRGLRRVTVARIRQLPDTIGDCVPLIPADRRHRALLRHCLPERNAQQSRQLIHRQKIIIANIAEDPVI
jgi:hypothetical protein